MYFYKTLLTSMVVFYASTSLSVVLVKGEACKMEEIVSAFPAEVMTALDECTSHTGYDVRTATCLPTEEQAQETMKNRNCVETLNQFNQYAPDSMECKLTRNKKYKMTLRSFLNALLSGQIAPSSTGSSDGSAPEEEEEEEENPKKKKKNSLRNGSSGPTESTNGSAVATEEEPTTTMPPLLTDEDLAPTPKASQEPFPSRDVIRESANNKKSSASVLSIAPISIVSMVLLSLNLLMA